MFSIYFRPNSSPKSFLEVLSIQLSELLIFYSSEVAVMQYVKVLRSLGVIFSVYSYRHLAVQNQWGCSQNMSLNKQCRAALNKLHRQVASSCTIKLPLLTSHIHPCDCCHLIVYKQGKCQLAVCAYFAVSKQLRTKEMQCTEEYIQLHCSVQCNKTIPAKPQSAYFQNYTSFRCQYINSKHDI